jgi:hypothetical protein
VPPFVGVAVKSIAAPAQLLLLVELIVTEDAIGALTAIVIAFAVAALLVAQVKFVVIAHVTIAPFTRALFV